MPDISLKFTLVHSNDWSHADERRLSSRNKNPPQASPIFPSPPQVLRQHKHISTRQAGVQLDHATTPPEKRMVLDPSGTLQRRTLLLRAKGNKPWRKTKPTTPLGVGSPSDPKKFCCSHLGSSSGPRRLLGTRATEEQLEMITAEHARCDGQCPLIE